MDRLITYPGELIDHHDPMLVNHFAMIGLGKLAQAVLGDQPQVRGLACEPTAPASLQVQLMPGEIYSLQNIDSTPYGDLPADTQHTIVKQGMLLASKLLDCPAPATEGHGATHLIQVSFTEPDVEKDLLPYYNASNPQQVWWGPDNEGKAQPTVRRGICQVMLKTGVSAPTGSQKQPAVDVGYVGLYAITVAHGQTVINTEHIRRVDNAPFIDEALTQKISKASADQRYLTQAQGDGRYVKRGDDLLPPGTVCWFARPTPPEGYLVCNGEAVSRRTYKTLFEVIGTIYGKGDGKTTFNLPNVSGRFICGWNNGPGLDAGREFGALQDSQNLAHSHDVSVSDAGDHTHKARTDTQGEHNHDVNDPGHSHSTQSPFGRNGGNQIAAVGPYFVSGYYNTNPAGTGIWLNGNGNHAHDVEIENEGGHSHVITVNDEGGNEARPNNIALLAMIRH